MKRETIDATTHEIAMVIKVQREIAQAEINLAETVGNKAYWEGYNAGLSKAYRAIQTHLQQFKD